jgi:prepilin-type N-terminal cleavage/methylation domain-containing protein
MHVNMKKESPGFTLVEIVITLIVLSVLGAFTFSYLFTGIQTHSATYGSQTLHEELSLVIERCVREVRDAVTATTTGSTNVTLTKAHATTPDPRITVTYTQNTGSTILQRGDAGVGYATLSKDLASGPGFAMTYDDNSGTTSKWDDGLRFTFALVTQNGIAVTRSTFVSPRNIRWTDPADPTCTPNCTQNFDSHYKGRVYQGDYQDVIQ